MHRPSLQTCQSRLLFSVHKYPRQTNGSLVKLIETGGVDGHKRKFESLVPSRVQTYCSLYILDLQKKMFSQWGQSSMRTSCSVRLYSLCSCRFSKPGQTSPEYQALCSWFTLLWAGGWTRDHPRALPSSVLLWFCPAILYSDTSHGVCRYVRIYSMCWGWNLLPAAILAFLWPHKSHVLSELLLMQLQ